MLHFATHSIIRDDRAMESFLALQRSKLTAAEIYELKLDAGLVFLSSCRSGMGWGAGITGLTRAFFAGWMSLTALTGKRAR